MGTRVYTSKSARPLFGKACDSFSGSEVVWGSKQVLELLRLCEWIRGGQLLHFLEIEDHGHAEDSLGLETYLQASPGVQGLRIHLLMQGVGTRSPVREDPTCRGATEATGHSYWSLSAQSPYSATRGGTARRRPHTTAGELPPFAAARESPRPATQTQPNKHISKSKFLQTYLQRH